MNYFQQGDTLLFKIDAIPEKAKLQKGESVLHHGATGNHHTLTGKGFGIYTNEDKKFLDIVEDTVYKHEEHNPITIPSGKYELKFVQEKDHFSDLVRPVVD